ncbi:MAG: septal ring lytic transglycosylase RlpA family protein [Burkholderiales bacterium]|nr:septal ring lytic transglycosylase RlpA family protein [Burkholderiales bacterium]
MSHRLAVIACIALLAGCAAAPPEPPGTAPRVSAPTASSRYYADDGPPDSVPPNLDALPDAVPRLEPLHRFANRPYVVMGREYVPATSLRPYRERGVASWYGRKFHGRRTSIGETYDMFAMTAAHPTLPLPSYARVTNAATGASVVVRVNDRGPFLHGRVIDLSYAAAHRLGIAQRGSGEVEVEAMLPPEAAATALPLPPVAQPATPASPPIVAETPAGLPAGAGFVVQLGAFANFANAQSFLAHVQNQTASASVEPRVRQSGGLWRVYVGPYADRDEAVRAADRIAGAFGFATAVRPH